MDFTVCILLLFPEFFDNIWYFVVRLRLNVFGNQGYVYVFVKSCPARVASHCDFIVLIVVARLISAVGRGGGEVYLDR